MAIRNSTAVRNAIVQAYETAIGASPTLEIRTGAPGAPTAAATGTLLVTIAVPADWLSNPANGAAARIGTWSAAAVAAGTAGQYRLLGSDGTCHETGIVAMTAAGDLVLDNTNIAVNQVISVGSWTLTALYA